MFCQINFPNRQLRETIVMAVIQRALLTWFLSLVFLILVFIRLSQPTQWNWFIVFIPMWIFDGTVLTYAGFYLVSRCRTEPRNLCSAFVVRKLQFVIVIGLKLTLQILICCKLEFPSWNLPLYYVFIPLWCILLFLLVNIVHSLIEISTSRQLSLKFFSSQRTSPVSR